MNWHAAMEDELRMLKRIVALLSFFAWLARLSCALPRSARGHMLSVLLRAETRAREFMVGMALDHGEPPPPAFLLISCLNDDTFADAMRLAQSFRTLAVLLDRLAGDYLGPATHHTNGTRCATSGHRVANLLATLSRMLANTTGLQFHAATTHLAVQRIDSS